MAQTDLGKWMITNGGEYDPSVTYEQLTMVKYGNSTYITLKTVTGVTPDNDKINYQLMAQGFDATALSSVTAQDSQGLLGDKGSEVSAQSLIDALADKVMNAVIAKLGTGTLPAGMNDVISGLTTLNSNISSKANANHTHDDRYYTESEINAKLKDIVLMKVFEKTGTFSEGKSYNLSYTVPSGYKYLSIAQVITTGWIGSVYCVPDTSKKTMEIWVESGSGTGNIDVYALFIKN